MIAWIALAAAGPLGPGIPIKQVVPPPVVLEQVDQLEIRIDGPAASAIAAELVEAIEDEERMLNPEHGQLGKNLVEGTADMAADYVGNAVGGGLQGKLAAGLAKGAAGMLANELEVEHYVPDDGLHTQVFDIVDGGADAVLAGRVHISSDLESSVIKENVLDSDGNVVLDSDGHPVQREIPCRTRSASVEFRWAILKKGEPAHSDSVVRRNSDRRCGDDIKNLASEEQLSGPLIGGYGPIVAAEIVPSWKASRIPLSKSKHLAPDLKLVKAGAYFDALCAMHGHLKYAANDVDALQSAAGLNWALGAYDDAERQLATAVSLKPNKSIAKALQKLRDRREEVSTLTQTYGMVYTVAKPDLKKCPPEPEGRRAVLKKNTDLRDEAGNVLLALDKGTRIWVQSEEGKVAGVALATGQVGMIDAKTIK